MVAYNGPAIFPPAGAPVFTAYTPTISSGTGTITTSSATGRYWQYGKLLYFSVAITITTNGTGATSVNFTLPISLTPAANEMCLGRATVVSGKALQCLCTGASNVAQVFNYDNTYPGANTEVIVVSGVIEVI